MRRRLTSRSEVKAHSAGRRHNTVRHARITLSIAAAHGSAQARQLLAQAEKIKNDEQAQYQAREQARKDWERWMQSTPSPYYWHWGHHGWQRY